MPELPEVETVCQALKPVLEGQSFVSIQLNRSNLRYPLPSNIQKVLASCPIINVRRRAKYLLIDFKHSLTLIWHLGMSGRVIIENVHAPFLKSSPHDHVIFMTSHHYKITYRDPRRFGFLLVSPTQDLEALRPFNTLGPEPLENSNLNASKFHSRIKSKSASIKSALLDQKVIAGIGNIYVA
jgi:formamidopyrimidine-DNA glycosylase